MEKLLEARNNIRNNPVEFKARFILRFRKRHERFRALFESLDGQTILNARNNNNAVNNGRNGEGTRAEYEKAKAVERVLKDAAVVEKQLDKYADQCAKSLPFIIDVLLNNSEAICKRFFKLYEEFMYGSEGNKSSDFQNTLVLGKAGSGKTYSAAVLAAAIKHMGYFIVPRKLKPIVSYSSALEAARDESNNIKSATNLTSTYTSGGGKQVQMTMFKFMERPMILDEAYALTPGEKDTGKSDSVNELVNLLGSPLSDTFLIIAIGYPKEMDAFLQSNEGFKRRFPHRALIKPDSYQFVCTFTHALCRKGLSPRNRKEEFCDVYGTKACKYSQTPESFRGWDDDVFDVLDEVSGNMTTIYPGGEIDGAVKLANAVQRLVNKEKATLLKPCHIILNLPEDYKGLARLKNKYGCKAANAPSKIARELIKTKMSRLHPVNKDSKTPAPVLLYKTPLKPIKTLNPKKKGSGAKRTPQASPQASPQEVAQAVTTVFQKQLMDSYYANAKELESYTDRTQLTRGWQNMLKDKYSGFSQLRSVRAGNASRQLRKMSGRSLNKTPPKISKNNILKDLNRLTKAKGTVAGGAVLQEMKDKYGASLNSRTVPQAIEELRNMANEA